MTKETKDSFLEFIQAVEDLTAATMITIGIDTASSIMTRCEKLKLQLGNEGLDNENRD